MKILQILETAPTGLKDSSALGLRNSFNNEQWSNIVCHFLKTAKEQEQQQPSGTVASSIMSFFIDDDTINSTQLVSMHRRVGKDMPTGMSPSQWQSYAQLYGMQVPNVTSAVSWEQIYNHLEPFHNAECDLVVRAPNTRLGTSDDVLLDTQETRQEFIRLVSSAGNNSGLPDPLESYEQLLSFFNDGIDAIKVSSGRDETDSLDPQNPRNWNDYVTSNTENNPLKPELLRRFESLTAIINDGGTLPKADVIEQLWQFTLAADRLIATYRRRSSQTD
jgi:hypothetical protein